MQNEYLSDVDPAQLADMVRNLVSLQEKVLSAGTSFYQVRPKQQFRFRTWLANWREKRQQKRLGRLHARVEKYARAHNLNLPCCDCLYETDEE